MGDKMNYLYTKIMDYISRHNGDKEISEITVSNLYDAADNDAKEAINSIFIEMCGVPLGGILFLVKHRQKTIDDENKAGINLENKDWFRQKSDAVYFIGEYKLVCTSVDCPEQYDVYKGSDIVAYFRIRWGHFTARCPYFMGELVFSEDIEGFGEFTESERVPMLKEAIKNVDAYYRLKKYREE